MIEPDKVVTGGAAKMNLNLATLGITKASELSEDAEESKLRPPYCGIFADFDSESSYGTNDEVQVQVPVEIKILCCSAEKKTAALAFAEAFTIASKISQLMPGQLSVDGGEVTLFLRKKPFDIIRNASDGAVVQVNFYYHLDSVGA